MRIKMMWMLAAILTCGLGMTLASCSDNDDNAAGTGQPAELDDGYRIVVGEGMTMPVDEFLTVEAVAGDPDVVAVLKAIDRVTDVKAYILTTGYDYLTLQNIEKTAYYFNYKQDIDHNAPSKGWFKQQCVLTVAGKDRPTVLHTAGYALEEKKNRLDGIGEPAIVKPLDANCLQVEYRYHGWSLPEGWTNDFHYLTAKQHSDDLHAIVTAIKQSGIISQDSKWVSTGVSKNGMTTAHYAYYYPNEMDAYVPFCAPFLLSLYDQRPYSFIISKAAFDEDTEKCEKVKAAFRAYVGDRTLQAECVKLYKQSDPLIAAYTDKDARMDLLGKLFDNFYGKMSYVEYYKWEPLIPKAGDSAQKFYDFIMANQDTKYENESADEHKRRKEYADNLEHGARARRLYFVTRSGTNVERYDAYDVQVNIELGTYAFDLSWVEDLLTDDEKDYFKPDGTSNYGVTYDNGKFISEFLDGMRQSDCNMMFVYGMQDPWTGGQIPDDKLGRNSQKLFIKNGIHNDYIDTWTASERNQLFQWLKGLGFDL